MNEPLRRSATFSLMLPLPTNTVLEQQLEDKRQCYLTDVRLQLGLNGAAQHDLRDTHDTDENFRFLYYKFVILCDVLLAVHAYRKSDHRDDLATQIEARYIKCDLSVALGRPIDDDSFKEAANHVLRYLTSELTVEA